MTTHPTFNALTPSHAITSAFPLSIANKTILITGVSPTGLGGATALALASHSPQLLILTGRTPSKVTALITTIHSSHPSVPCRLIPCDLSSQTSTRAAAAEILALPGNIDIVINNAGIMAPPARTLSEDGVELQFATNHLGHFLLTNLLLPKLLAAAETAPKGAVRVVNVSSLGHRFGPVRFSDLAWEKELGEIPAAEHPKVEMIREIGLGDADGAYIPTAAYACSKTANVLFSLGLNRRLYGRFGVASFAVHPGSVETELQRWVDQGVLRGARERAGVVSRKTLEQGASTGLVAALDGGLGVRGVEVYLSDCQVERAEEWARDEEAAERLWGVSEELVRERFEIK